MVVSWRTSDTIIASVGIKPWFQVRQPGLPFSSTVSI